MAEISDLITELKQEHKEDKDQADALFSLETAFPTQLGQSLIASGVISEASSGLHTSLLEEIRAGIGGMKESFSTRLGNFVKGFNVFQLGFGASDRGRRKTAKESAHREALMQADIKDLSEYFNRGHGLARALTEHQNKGVLGKMFGKGRLKQQEKEDEAGVARQKQTGLLMSIAENTGGINEEFMKKDDKEKKPFDFMSLLKKIALGAAIAGIIAFLNSDYWENMKLSFDGLKKSLISLYENYLLPIWDIFKNYIVKSWDNIKTLFTGLKESFALFGEGKWWEGIKKFFGSIGTYLSDQLDAALTLLWNVIATIFGISETDSVFGSISGFFTDMYDEVISWIKITWFNISTTISEAWTNIKNSVVKVFTDVKDWFVEKWTWASDVVTTGWTSVKAWMQEIWDGVWGWFTEKWDWASDVVTTGWTNIKDYIQGIWNGVKEWFTGKWTWASDVVTTGWTTVKDYISGVWDSVVGWFKGLWTWGKKEGATEEGTWKGITNFITGVWDSVVGWFKGLFTWGKTAGATEEGGWSFKTFIDGAFTKVKDWIVSLFTWATAPVGPKDSWIKKTVNAVVTKVQEWALSLFAWAETPGGSWISKIVKDAIILVKAWALSLFSWASTAGQVEGKPWSLSALIDAAVLQVITWVKSLFTWATSDEATDPADFSIKGMIKKVLKTIIGWVTGLWTWANTDEATDPAGFSISGMIKKVIKTVVGWVTGLFTWVSKAGHVKDEKGKDKPWSFMTVLGAVVTKIIDWVAKLFSWGADIGAKIAGKFTGLGSMIGDIFKKVKDWFFGIFGFGTDEEGKDKPIQIKEAKGFSLATLITGIFESIKQWFTDTLKFDFSGLLDSLPEWIKDPQAAVMKMIKKLTKFLPSWLGGPDKSEADMKKEAEKLEAAAKKKNEAELKRRADRQVRREEAMENVRKEIAEEEENIRRSKAGENVYVGREWKGREESAEDIVESNQKLQKLITQNEKAKALDIEFKKKATTKSKNSSIFTHDQGLHDRLDKIFSPANQLGPVMPSTGGQIMNATRTSQMQEAGLRRGAGGGGGGPTIVNAPVNNINNSSSNMTNTTTSFSHPSAILNTVNAAA